MAGIKAVNTNVCAGQNWEIMDDTSSGPRGAMADCFGEPDLKGEQSTSLATFLFLKSRLANLQHE
jgi:hypothetical protein